MDRSQHCQLLLPVPAYKNSTDDFRGMGESNVAICVIGAPRTVVETFSSIRSSVVEQLSGDIFLHLQFPKYFSPAFETDLHQLGGIVTALLVPQMNLKLMESGFQSELKHHSFYGRYASVGGPWKSPLYGQLGGSLWLSKHQGGCKRMVEDFEKQRGHQYEWFFLHEQTCSGIISIHRWMCLIHILYTYHGVRITAITTSVH